MKLIIAIICCFVLLQGCKINSAQHYLVEAETLSNQQKFDEAILMLNKALALDPNLLGAYINRGADQSALGNYEAAIQDYMQVLVRDSANTLALFNIANNYKRLENYHDAIAYYNAALATKGGPFYIDVKQHELLSQEIYDVPSEEIFYERGIAYYFVDSLDLAYTDLTTAINEEYMVSSSLYWIGHVYLAKGQNDSACYYLNKSSNKGDADALVELERYCVHNQY